MIEPLLPPAKPGGRPRTVGLWAVLNAIFYLVKQGCGWQDLPSDFPVWQTVYTDYRAWVNDGTWDAIHNRLRAWVQVSAGRPDHPAIQQRRLSLMQPRLM
ncbi:IS5 family transposase [Leptolyngbya sp. BL0902]|nr:IS5 family transposase [Leptolyngbya sp. BL0902]